jgi:hypothetical protein
MRPHRRRSVDCHQRWRWHPELGVGLSGQGGGGGDRWHRETEEVEAAAGSVMGASPRL